MKIFLIGYMGCGKSTLGRQLSRKLIFDFVDLDTFIEEREGATVAQIFETHGQDYFRKAESEALLALSKRENIVVATGGGAPLFGNNLSLMNSCGLTIYIKVDYGILASRLENSHTTRPLLAGKNPEELRQFINEMMELRAPYYESAMATVEGKNIKVDQLVEVVKGW